MQDIMKTGKEGIIWRGKNNNYSKLTKQWTLIRKTRFLETQIDRENNKQNNTTE